MTEENMPVNEKNACTKRSRWRRWTILCAAIGGGFLLCVIFWSLLALTRVNVTLSNMFENVHNAQIQTNADVQTFKITINTLEKELIQAQDALHKQAVLNADWQATPSANLDKWHVAEAAYLVRLANDHLQYTQNQMLALHLLTRAQDIIGRMNDARLIKSQQLLATAITTLQSSISDNELNVFQQLNKLNTAVDKLQLPATPLPPENKDKPLDLADDLPWWKVGLKNAWHGIKKVVVIQNIDEKMSPLVMPSSEVYLFQNLHAVFERAMWAAVRHNQTVFDISISNAMQWIQRYFAPDHANTQAMLQALTVLQKEKVTSPVLDLSSIVTDLQNYLSQTNPPAPAPVAVPKT